MKVESLVTIGSVRLNVDRTTVSRESIWLRFSEKVFFGMIEEIWLRRDSDGGVSN